MRSTWKTLAAVAVGLMLAPQVAVASTDVEEQLRLMQERMAQLEDRVTAADEQREAAEERAEQQAVLLEQAGLEESEGSVSRISNFLDQTDFSGWVAASYFYNFANPVTDDGESGAGGNGPLSNPHHPDHNSFQLDEIWLTVDGSANENKKAGFFFELVYGRTGGVLGNTGYILTTADTDSDGQIDVAFLTSDAQANDFWIPTGYVEYMASPYAKITAGKFGTYVGYEVVGAANNVNITRGFTWNLFQPVNHVGAAISGDFEGGFDYALAVTNGDFLGDVKQPDDKHNKTVMWHLGWGSDTLNLGFNGTWGIDEDDLTGYVIDFIGEFTPTDNILTWINFDYLSGDGLGDNYGLSLGGRYGFTDAFGLGGRFEWGRTDPRYSGLAPLKKDDDLYSLTITTDFELVENLVWKVETKWENAAAAIFRDGKNSTQTNQVILGTQLYYAF